MPGNDPGWQKEEWNRMKKTLKLLLALVMLAAVLTGCGQTSGTKTYKIAVVLKTLNSEYWGKVKDGCDKAAKDLGVTVDVLGAQTEADVDEQCTIIEQQIAAGVDAIVCAPNNGDAAAAKLKAALDKKIPVLFVDTDANLSGKTAFVGTSNEDAAALGGEFVGKQIAGAKVAIIYGQEGENTSNMRRAGFKKGLEANGAKVVVEMSGENTTSGAQAAMESILGSNPEIQAVCCHNDDSALGAMNACQAAGRSDILIVGFDGNASAIEQIKAGKIAATVAQQPTDMGYQAVEYALKAVKGEKVDAVISVPCKLITKDNA